MRCVDSYFCENRRETNEIIKKDCSIISCNGINY